MLMEHVFRGSSASPPGRLLAGLPTLCFRGLFCGLFRGRFRLRCFRGASAKRTSSLRRYRTKTRAYVKKSFRKSFLKRSASAQASESFRAHSGNHFSKVVAGRFPMFFPCLTNFPSAPILSSCSSQVVQFRRCIWVTLSKRVHLIQTSTWQTWRKRTLLTTARCPMPCLTVIRTLTVNEAQPSLQLTRS